MSQNLRNPPLRTIAILAPGDMGHAVGAVLRAGGLRVITSLAGRSPRTRSLAEQAGIEDVPGDRDLVAQADALLSILVPARALELARRLAPAIREQQKGLLYVDCNAIAPETARAIGEVIEDAGGRFVDAGIIGPPPRPGATGTRFYASGAHTRAFEQLRGVGLEVRPVGEHPGDASALKMCYAALTKGTCALMTELSIAAERLGVSEPLVEEFAFSQPHHLEWMRKWVQSMVPKAHRWVGEMDEIAKTFEATGQTAITFHGAAEVYRFVAQTELGRTSPEEWADRAPSFDEVIRGLAASEIRKR